MHEENKDLAPLIESYKQIITSTGEDLGREGLLRTPLRAAQSLLYLTSGYKADPVEILKKAIFKANKQEHMVVVENIDVYSLCEHHLLPFFGKAFLAYFPNKHIVGLSKVPRFIEVLSRRLQVQENLTMQILDNFQKALEPKGVAIAIRCQHLCMSMRGVKQQESITTTTAFNGTFNSIHHQQAFLNIINK